MALKKTVTTAHGFVADGAYHRVEDMTFQGKNVIKFNVKSYKDSSASTPFAVVDFGCGFDLSGENPFAQAYAYLKMMPEFEGAIDC